MIKFMDKWLEKLTFNGKKIIDADTLISNGIVILLIAFMIYFNDNSVDDELLYRPMIN